jgi:hypothetical protein
VAGEGGVDGDAGGGREQGGEVGHGVRCGAEAHVPVCGGVAGPVHDGVRVKAVGGGAGRGDEGAVAQAGQGSGVRGELFVHGAPVRCAEAGCFLDQEGGAPFVELAGVECGEGVRHFGDEGFGQAQEAAAAGGGFAPGQGNLRRDALSELRGREAGCALGAPLAGIKRDSDPGLQPGGRRLQVLKVPELADQRGTVTGKTDTDQGPDHIRDGECIAACYCRSHGLRIAFHESSLSGTTDILTDHAGSNQSGPRGAK